MPEYGTVIQILFRKTETASTQIAVGRLSQRCEILDGATYQKCGTVYPVPQGIVGFS